MFPESLGRYAMKQTSIRKGMLHPDKKWYCICAKCETKIELETIGSAYSVKLNNARKLIVEKGWGYIRSLGWCCPECSKSKGD